ncbi:probable enoyl-CoA hydratase 2, mitochondrial isoform X2 [Nymphaea colorata]|uniref:probable enoyl-CoA hydratase 2, mitochondrial isoform X2 n=1 Tax=Nymphaea colorata TaxID=210225 RepID=UPI00129D8B1D|nr:probable enoyl-CoA hydratase 2, mitochondrial isoform X2 [Nymphaea colorata]
MAMSLVPCVRRSLSAFRCSPKPALLCQGVNSQFIRNLILETISEPIKTQRLSGSDSGIVEVSLDRPGAKNAIGNDMLKGLRRTIEVMNEDPSERRLMSPEEVRHFVNTLRSTFLSLEALHAPTIAVVEGVALGGGLELALSCDLRICGGDAVFAMPETALAIIPGAGGTQRLPRLVGKTLAKELIFTGRKFHSEDALEMGLVNYCVPAGEAYSKALEIARDISQKGPLAVRMAKIAINKGMEMDLSSGMQVEEDCYERVLNSKDRLEGLAAFADKRKPAYNGE